MAKPTQTERLHIMHASHYVDASQAAFRAQYNYQFNQKPDIVTFTESGGDRGKWMSQEARDHDYRPVTFRNTDVAMAFRVGKENQLWVKDSGQKLVHPPVRAGVRPGVICWVKLNWKGQTVWIHTAHWTAKAREASRRDEHTSMSREMGKMVREHAKGEDMSFFSGDLNAEKGEWWYPGSIFRETGLITCWEDNDKAPPTHGRRTIDIIGRHRYDSRVSLGATKVHPKMASDHRAVSAWYKVEFRKKRDDEKDDGKGGDKGKGDGIKLPNHRSFKDYTDDEIFNLPQAVDEEDTENG